LTELSFYSAHGKKGTGFLLVSAGRFQNIQKRTNCIRVWSILNTHRSFHDLFGLLFILLKTGLPGTMRLTILLLLLLTIPVFLMAQGTVYHVKPGGTGTGLSWDQASGNLNAILKMAFPGDEVWVAAGTYTPTKDPNERHRSFVIVDGVKLLGGFVGTETSADQRSWLKNKTILSGEIGAPGPDDNVYNVVFTKNVTEKTVIDGFIIEGGNANTEGEQGSRSRSGGAWYNDGSNGGNSSPTIANCIFRNNKAWDGAAFYNNCRRGNTSPVLKNCTFQDNIGEADGGGFYNDAQFSGTAVIRLSDCRFIGNMAQYGAGIFVETGNGTSKISCENCYFQENMAYLWGGGLYKNPRAPGEFSLFISECQFKENFPTDVDRLNIDDYLKKKTNMGDDHPAVLSRQKKE
jgi:hypothetical protein